MTMMGFHELFPEVAENECRTVIPFNNDALPRRTFLFMEFYCIDPNCDCRRVLINVIDTERDKHVATINYAFEPPEPPFDDEGQMFLDPLNPQSSMSGAFLDLFEEMIRHDHGYHDRLVRHYRMWKEVVNDPGHPDHAKVRTAGQDDPLFSPAFTRGEPVRRDGPKIGANDPCPCGSGRKYKKCCRK